MEAPNLHATAALAIAVVAFWQFANSKIRIEIVSLLLVAGLALLFYVWPVERGGASAGIEIAFGGFSHEALIAICCLMILGRGLVVTGALEPAARVLTKLWQYNRAAGLLTTLAAAALMSMIVNDTPVLVLLLPLLLNLASRIGASASKILMPVNCAILIGGMATTIGTSTNLLVVSIAESLGLPQFGVFAFTDIALLAGLVAVPYLWLVMPRLLPANVNSEEKLTRDFHAALHASDATEARRLTPDEVQKLLQEHDIICLAITSRTGVSLASDAPLRREDIIRVRGRIESLRQVAQLTDTSLAVRRVLDELKATRWTTNQDLIVAEIAIGADSPLVGSSIRSAQISDRYGVAILGLHRPDATLGSNAALLRDERMRVGDVLLVQGTRADLEQLQIGEGSMLLEGAAEMPRTARAPLAIAIFVASVALAALHVLPIAISSLAGAIAMFATGCVRFDRLGRALSSKVILLVAASIALGRALLETGAAAWMGQTMALGLQGFPPAVVLAAMMAFAALLTNFSSNTAAAAVGTPIAFSLAQTLGIAAEPLVLAVLFGCNLCFATPVAYQTNILIMAAGGYQFRDYVRAGLPLVLLMIVTLSTLLVWKYGL